MTEPFLPAIENELKMKQRQFDDEIQFYEPTILAEKYGEMN